MTALAFIVVAVLLFAVLLAYETSSDPTQPRIRQYGLFSWLVRGNWPAKVGAALLILGIGSLIRYGLVYVEVPPELKLGSGIIATGILGFVASWLRRYASRRALYLAFAGAALGTAYLTAYSTYALFGYVNDSTGLALLVLVAIGGGVFAVNTNTPSIAILAMTGAFAAPAFAIGHPQPLIVNGYYLAASALTFLMIWRKGWRPLIHLSFLFTLAGSLFFGWTHEFYRPEYYDTMQPLLFALVGIHLVMPLAESCAHRGPWLQRFDIGYFLALPLIATVLTLAIAPHARTEGAIGIAGLALMWGLAGLVLRSLKRDQASMHLLVSLLLAVLAAFLYLNNVPWPLVGLVASALILSLAPRLQLPQSVSALVAGIMLLLAASHVLTSLGAPRTERAFQNHLFAERIIAVIALGWGAVAARRDRLSLAPVLIAIAIGLGAITLISELARLHYAYLPQAVHAGLTLIALGISALYAARTLPAWITTLLAASIVISAWWAATSAPDNVTIMLFILGAISLTLLGRGGSHRHDGNEGPGILAAASLVLLVLPWATRFQALYAINTPFFVFTLAVGAVLCSVLLGETFGWRNRLWHRTLLPLAFWLVAFGVGAALLFRIERGFWAVGYELLSLSALFVIANSRAKESSQAVEGIALITLAAFAAQAMLLRIFGPAGPLSIADLGRMQLPALISLMWATLGGGLCWWATRISTRSVWSLGAVLLVISAIKLVFFDFDSLGQLGNIVALILAGLVFMGVAWLAPFPPKASNKTFPESNYSGRDEKAEARHRSVSGNESGATIGIAAGLILLAGAGFFVYPGMEHIAAQATAGSALSGMPAPPHPAVETDARESRMPSRVTADLPDTAVPTELDNCKRFIAQLPQEYVLYTAGSQAGRKTSSSDAGQFDVVVDAPGKDVVLALGAFESSVWNIKAMPGTRIVGVHVSGHHKQSIAGLAPGIPVLNTNYDNQGSCGYFYLAHQSANLTDVHMQQLFGKPAALYVLADDGKIMLDKFTVGEILSVHKVPPIREAMPTPTAAPSSVPTLSGEEGLAQLILEGNLRPARSDDIRAWEILARPAGVSQNTPSQTIPLHRAYVVLAGITLPSGLYGGHSASFIVPKGVPYPLGDPGHSRIFDMNNGTCSGLTCGIK